MIEIKGDKLTCKAPFSLFFLPFTVPPLIGGIALFLSALDATKPIEVYGSLALGFIIVVSVGLFFLHKTGFTIDRKQKSLEIWSGFPLLWKPSVTSKINLVSLKTISITKEVHCGNGQGHVTSYILSCPIRGDKNLISTFSSPAEALYVGEKVAHFLGAGLCDMTDKQTKHRSAEDLAVSLSLRNHEND